MKLVSSLKESALTAFVSALLLFPIVGLVLDNRSLFFKLERTAWMVLVVFLGRMLILTAYKAQLHRHPSLSRFNVLDKFKARFHWMEQNQRIFSLATVGILLLIPLLPFSGNYLILTLTLALVYIMLGMGLNIVVGLAGLLDLGYVAFYAVGAYAYALLAKHYGISFWMAIPITALLAAGAGTVLGFPVLRMHGDYLAIVTLGFGEIIRILLVNMTGFTGGPNGMSAPRPSLFGLEFTREAKQGGIPFHEFFGIDFNAYYRYVYLYLIALLFTLFVIFVFKRLREMPMGRAWEALREDEVACKALGINHTTTKLSAFTLGASFAGIAGVLFAAMEGFINPSSFTFLESAIILSIVVLGGMGSILGIIIAAVAVTLLPELFREFQQYRMLIFGMAMVFIMVWRPGGLIKVRRKSFVDINHDH